jgi:hypothetical protein
MKSAKKIGLFLLAGFLGLCALEIGQQLAIPGVRGLAAPAEAVVGRPVTPVSVAGVARRTARRN